jgi:Fe(3+) dicitrate transport protein
MKPTKNMKPTTNNLLSLLAIFAAAGSAQAQESIEVIEELDSSSIVGNTERLFRLAGSAAYLDEEIMKKHHSTNINQIVASVPGVFARDEAGNGFFPNLSIRGADGVRMDRTTIMEDGILMAPAPYSAPSAYYSPTIGRMRGLEILKGSSQVKYGPHTTGGVVNYLSTEIPTGETFFSKLKYGSNHALTSHSYFGNTLDTSNGKFGYLLEMFYDRTDGFRDIQSTAANPNPDDTGHSIIEPMIKLAWEPDTALKQKFEFLYGYSDLDANETYLGLTDDDFRRNPDMRYAGSRFDNFASQHHRTHFKYSFAPTSDLSFDATAYYNQFDRNWYRLGRVGSDRTSLHTVLGNPLANATQFGILNGTTAGPLDVKANNRSYESYGLQLAGRYTFEALKASNTSSFGARLHKDSITLFQHADRYNMNANGGVDSVQSRFRGPDLEGNQLQEAKAIALWLENEMDYGKIAIKPGARYEYVDQHFANYATSADFNGSANYFAPGIGFTYDINDTNIMFGGVYKGFALPGPASSLEKNVEPEENLGYEIGLRHRTERINAELALFYNDYSNIISSDTGLGDTSPTNAGAATVYGLEASVSYDLLHGNEGYSMPVYSTATLTSAEIDNALATGGEGDIYSGGVAGARIPYIPEFQGSFGIGFHAEKWGANLDATYIGESFGTALEDTAAAGTSSRNGAVGDGFTVDLSTYYQWNENVKLISGLSNMFDDRFISSRLPEGARANPGRTIYAGFEVKF